MRTSHWGLGMILLIGATAIGSVAHCGSLWASRLTEIVPANVELTDVEERSRYLHIAGEAKEIVDVSALMRAIDQAGLGSPDLQRVTRAENHSKFVLRVKSAR